MGEEKENIDSVWVYEFEMWVLWVSKNDLVAGVDWCDGTVVVVEEREEIKEEEEDKGRKKCWHLGHWAGLNRRPCGQPIKTKP